MRWCGLTWPLLPTKVQADMENTDSVSNQIEPLVPDKVYCLLYTPPPDKVATFLENVVIETITDLTPKRATPPP